MDYREPEELRKANKDGDALRGLPVCASDN